MSVTAYIEPAKGTKLAVYNFTRNKIHRKSIDSKVKI
jgi:hypothetical protein